MHTVDQRAYRDAMALYATGVSILAADDGVHAHALTVSSFTSVSLEPPLLLVCVNDASAFLGVVRSAQRFALNILRAEHAALGKLFATAPQEERVSLLRRAAGEPPRLETSLEPLVRFDCVLDADHGAGDHRVLIGRPLSIETAPGARPLVWWRGALGAGLNEPPT